MDFVIRSYSRLKLFSKTKSQGENVLRKISISAIGEPGSMAYQRF